MMCFLDCLEKKKDCLDEYVVTVGLGFFMQHWKQIFILRDTFKYTLIIRKDMNGKSICSNEERWISYIVGYR